MTLGSKQMMKMNCFKCCVSKEESLHKKTLRKSNQEHKNNKSQSSIPSLSFRTDSSRRRYIAEEIAKLGKGNISAEIFSYLELKLATQNFDNDRLLGEGGFGRVYKGHIGSKNLDVAVKQLDRNGFQGTREFLVEVLILSLLHHPNLVNLVGYCSDGDQRILVYEYMANGSLEDHLLGRRVIDTSKPSEEQNLVLWAQPLFRNKKKFHLMVDPLLEGKYPRKGLYQALAIAAMCLQKEASVRPVISDVVTALAFLSGNKKKEKDEEEEEAAEDTSKTPLQSNTDNIGTNEASVDTSNN
ncbi:hypothetical protein HAX54_001913 [Datura stramonium]|uniref:Protein kinase domain-containing protein n=1 Tax=Datura stramonium TaxID=4076 RepID=A0ABS8RV32_DATST|nr:hypothetical protein [Datura stramonium]